MGAGPAQEQQRPGGGVPGTGQGVAELVDGDLRPAQPVRLVGEVREHPGPVVAVPGGVRGPERRSPEFAGRPVPALVEAVPAAGGGQIRREQMKPAAGVLVVAPALDQLGRGGEVGVQQPDGVLAPLGGQGRQPPAGLLQPVHEFRVHALATERRGEAFGFDGGPLCGESGQGDRAVGQEGAAVHEGPLCVVECSDGVGGLQRQRFVASGKPVRPVVRAISASGFVEEATRPLWDRPCSSRA